MEKTVALKEIKPGARFFWQGLEFVKLGKEQGGILVVSAKILLTERFNKNEYNNNYKESTVRKSIESIKNKFSTNNDDLLDFTMNLTADNGDKDYGTYTAKANLGLLTCDLYRKYNGKKLMPRWKDDWVWLCTPSTGFGDYVRGAVPSGALDSYGAYYSIGVAPACLLKQSTLVIRRDSIKTIYFSNPTR
jgi:hypothetical protein